MERHGFIQDKLDVKVLILFVMSKVIYPVDEQTIYELCLQDDKLSYFDVLESIPEMVDTGHLEHTEEGYVITEKGKSDCLLTQDSIAFPVMQRAERAVERFNREIRRDSMVRTEILNQPSGDYLAVMRLDDEMGPLMTLELYAPSARQAKLLTDRFRTQADELFREITTRLTAKPAQEEN